MAFRASGSRRTASQIRCGQTASGATSGGPEAGGLVGFHPDQLIMAHLVERWFAELTTKKPRRGSHTAGRQLNTDIKAWIWNNNPRPYVWTKTADQILVSVANYCKRINDSGH